MMKSYKSCYIIYMFKNTPHKHILGRLPSSVLNWNACSRSLFPSQVRLPHGLIGSCPTHSLRFLSTAAVSKPICSLFYQISWVKPALLMTSAPWPCVSSSWCSATCLSALSAVLQPLWSLVCSHRGENNATACAFPKTNNHSEISSLCFLHCSVQELNPGKYVNDTSPKGIYAFIQFSVRRSKHWINALASQTNVIILCLCGLSFT